MTEKTYTLKEMRQTSNLTLTEVASIVNISYPSLINWEKGKITPNVVAVNALLELYGYTFDQLNLNEFENKERKTK